MAELKLDDVIKNLLGAIPEVSGVVISSRYGLPIASALPLGIQELEYVKLITTMYSLNENLAYKCFGPSEFDNFIIYYGKHIFITMAAGRDCLLTVYCTRDIRLGLILLDLKRTAVKIAE